MSVPAATGTSLEVEIRGVVPQSYLGKRIHAPVGDVGNNVQKGYADLFAKLAAAAVVPAGPPFLIASDPQGGEMDIELGVPCVAPPAAGDLSRWIVANGHTMAGPPREVYLTGPDVAGPEAEVTELIWPIG